MYADKNSFFVLLIYLAFNFIQIFRNNTQLLLSYYVFGSGKIRADVEYFNSS